ncbi:hypothetical protein BDV29DRAFT_66922 [Aspergillus leporis]|uniref:Uncharacterized protein n=1 Tax=Aspergillus leporis TaxID=41062 RepID=A0A5N5WL69_9EURO|nr:hypothetical protein BDV29DRAFT_66922 [Aspergillus leporis]
MPNGPSGISGKRRSSRWTIVRLTKTITCISPFPRSGSPTCRRSSIVFLGPACCSSSIACLTSESGTSNGSYAFPFPFSFSVPFPLPLPLPLPLSETRLPRGGSISLCVGSRKQRQRQRQLPSVNKFGGRSTQLVRKD